MIKDYCSAKRLLILLLLLFPLLLHAFQQRQGITIRASNASIENVFKQIEKQTGYTFFYSATALNGNEPVSLNLNKASLDFILNTILKGKNLTWQTRDNAVILSEKPLKKDTIPAFNISGSVINRSGTPIPGATVGISGTRGGVSTDDEGKFRFAGIKPNTIIIVSNVGYATKQVKIKDQTELNIILDTLIKDISMIDVVSTGYQNIPKANLTGSVTEVDKVNIRDRTGPDILSRIEGTPGIVFFRATNGLPSISIRGRSTIMANANALIIVDGFPYEGDPLNINPNDIESVTVLRDAAAASIWGALSGNGVIVLTTKKGRLSQKMKMEFSAFTTIAPRPDLKKNRNFIPSSVFIDMEHDLAKKGYYNADRANTITRPSVTPAAEIYLKGLEGLITPEEEAAMINELRNIDVRDEMKKHLYQQAVSQQYAFNISGGTEKVAYLMSLGYDKNKGSLIGSGYERRTINMATTAFPLQNIEVGFNAIYTESNTRYNQTASALSAGADGRVIYPYARFTDSAGKPVTITKDYNAEWIKGLAQDGRLLPWDYNPIEERDYADNKSKQSDIRINMGLKWGIVKGFNVEIKYQLQQNKSEERIFHDPRSYHARNLVNRYAQITAGGAKFNIPRGGQLSEADGELRADNGRIQLNFNEDLGINHHITAIAGFEIRQVQSTAMKHYYFGYDDETGTYEMVRYDSLYALNPSGSAAIPNYNSGMEGFINRSRSWYTNAAYTFMERYTLSLSGRLDQANIFGVKANFRQTPLYSIGSKWIMDKEPFYHIGWLPSLQLRFTMGYNANHYNKITAYTTGTMSNLTTPVQPPFANISALGNPGISWEKVRVINFGADFAFRIPVYGSIEYFRKKGTDLIGTQPIASSTGYTNIFANYANSAGSGFDFMLHATVISKGPIRWLLSYNISYATDKVTKYFGEANYLEGKPVNGIYAFRWAGLDPLTGDPQGYLNGQISKNYAELTNTPLKEKEFIGRMNPVLYGSLANTVQWKGFSLYASFLYKFGYYFIRESLQSQSLVKRSRGNIDYLNRWQNPGDEKFTPVPSFYYGANADARDAFYAGSEALVTKGDHIRLQDIRLTYQFSKAEFKKLPFRNIQLQLNISQAGVVWRANKFKIDPDYQQTIPPPPSFTMGARFSI